MSYGVRFVKSANNKTGMRWKMPKLDREAKKCKKIGIRNGITISGI
jgi:hypothetical protein